MSERRQQRRRERQRRRRQTGGAPTYEPVGDVQFTGIMGMMQRQARILFLIGIVVMVLSLGSIFFVTQLGGAAPHGGDAGDDGAGATPTVVASVEPTPAASSDDPADDEPVIVRSYAAAPEMAIDVEQTYEAIIDLDGGGEVRLELLPQEAPGYVNNFVFLARNQFFDGLTFHRVVPGFVAQAGDPSGTGFGDAGYSLAEETNDLTFGTGVLSMAKAGSIVNGSQFFITLGPAPHLDSGFTVFGRVTAGLELLQSLEARDPATSSTPGATIVSIEIVEGG